MRTKFALIGLLIFAGVGLVMAAGNPQAPQPGRARRTAGRGSAGGRAAKR